MGHQPRIITLSLNYLIRHHDCPANFFSVRLEIIALDNPAKKRYRSGLVFFVVLLDKISLLWLWPFIYKVYYVIKKIITFLKLLICAAHMWCALVMCISHSLRLNTGAWYYFHSRPRPPNLNFSHKRKVCLRNHVELAEPPTCAPQKALLTLLW